MAPEDVRVHVDRDEVQQGVAERIVDGCPLAAAPAVDRQAVLAHGSKATLGLAAHGLTLCKDDPISAIVMNATPFTKGHAHLVEQASRENKLVHLFLLSEDVSLVPYAARKELVERGIADFDNVVLHASGPYIISSATFPSYFLPDDDAASVGHAELDLTLFAKIAAALSIRRRYVGEEPFSQVTGLYNKVMREKLPELGVECRVIPRLAIAGRAAACSAANRRRSARAAAAIPSRI